MPMYTTCCEGCGTRSNTRLSFSDYDAVCQGTKSLECLSCHGKVVLKFNPGDVTFVLKDGESGGWTSKAMRENKYRARHQRVMERRQRDHAPTTKLVPNFAGQVTDNWREAKSMAYEEAYRETKNASVAQESASTYDALAIREGHR
jgi:hypothetical protein